jgi:hypothetical protein
MTMKSHFKFGYLSAFVYFGLVSASAAQDLGPGFTKIKDDIDAAWKSVKK